MTHLRAVTAAASFWLCLSAVPSAAQSFCDELAAIVAAAPQFASLRGEPEGMQFDGTLLLEGAAQCKIRNKSDLDDNWQPTNEKWAYECLWENRAAEALPALEGLVRACVPQASYSKGSALGAQFANFSGDVFRVGDNSIATDFNKDTNQLWLTVLPPGVEQWNAFVRPSLLRLWPADRQRRPRKAPVGRDAGTRHFPTTRGLPPVPPSLPRAARGGPGSPRPT